MRLFDFGGAAPQSGAGCEGTRGYEKEHHWDSAATLNYNINYRPSGRIDVGYQFTSYSEHGDYTFRVACDDAARLYIDGRLVTDVPYDAKRADNAIVSNSGSLTLVAGYHSIRIEYAEIGGGNAGLAIQGEWEFFH